MMINCKGASKLTSKKIDNKLSFVERLKLKFHIMMCGVCKLFETEATTIEHSMMQNKEEVPRLNDERLNSLKNNLS